MDKKTQEVLERGVADIIVKKSLVEKLSTQKKLRVKLGIDPTSAALHLGHTVVLRKLRQFQELGHTVIFLVGDFTASIGDPSDKLSARKPLSRSEIQANMTEYKRQAGMVLDINRAEVRFNSEWHSNMDFAELFQLASYFSVNQMLERDMFQERMKRNRPLWIHELLYPVLQGYDSVALKADVELGGTDQTFNVLAARDIQSHYHQPPQDVVTVELMEGTDGADKMSKSMGNTIELDDAPQEKYGKLMSIPDRLIIKYFTLLTDVPRADIATFEKEMQKGANPKDYKERLASTLVRQYHGAAEADKAREEFQSVFAKKELPRNIPEHALPEEGSYSPLDIITETKCASSKSEARRLVEQGGVSLEGAKLKDWKKPVNLKKGMVLRVGKRKFVRFV